MLSILQCSIARHHIYYIDAEGKVSARNVGFKPDAMESQVKKLLNKTKPDAEKASAE
jgi:hypothetical protein